MNCNGIPIKLRTDVEGGVETAYFATLRRSPGMATAYRAVLAAKKAVTVAGRRVDLAERDMVKAEDLPAVTAAGDALEAAENAVIDASVEFGAALKAFAVAGFAGAGYPPAEAERLAQASIEQCDAPGLIERLATPDAVVYADPPYRASTRSNASNDYAIDSNTDDDHRRLAEVLTATPADPNALPVTLPMAARGDGTFVARLEKADVDLGGELPQLIDGSGAIDIGRGEQDFFLAVFEQQRELAAGGGLARTLQAGHQNDGGRGGGEVEVGILAAHQTGQFFVDDADQRLPGRQAGEHFLAQRAGLHRLDERLDHG
jgi:hypothetical protein